MDKKKSVNFILILAIIGLVTSIYLVTNHFSSGSGGVCDFSETISCSLVNQSVYSKLLNVPVAVFGVLWFLVFLYLTYTLRENNKNLPKLFYWNVAGLVFVAYMVIAEVILKALCPFCTVVHVVIIATFGLIYPLFKKHKQGILPFIKNSKAFLIWMTLLFLLPIWIFSGGQEDGKYDELAKCMSDKGINMYSSFRCGFCAKTKEQFGSSMKYINEIECHPQGPHAQTALCQMKNVEGTPTWIMEPDGIEVKRQVGFMSIDELKEFSGCE